MKKYTEECLKKLNQQAKGKLVYYDNKEIGKISESELSNTEIIVTCELDNSDIKLSGKILNNVGV